MPPPPAPELKKPDYFLGSWTMDGDVKPGPVGQEGKTTGSTKFESIDGEYFMVSQTSHSGVMGEGTDTAYLRLRCQEKGLDVRFFQQR